MSSARSLAQKPIVPIAKAIKPANGPNPKNFTAKIARITSGNVLETAMMLRQKRYTHVGAQFRAAPSPIGMESKTPPIVEMTAIQILSRIAI